MKSSNDIKLNFYLIASNFLSQVKGPNPNIDLEILLEEVYKQGWEDGMSEGTEHARQLQLHKGKYE